MHDVGDSSNRENDWALDARLPAVIPVVRPRPAVPAIWRRALPHWRLALVAAVAASFRILTAVLWPFQSRLAAFMHRAPSRHETPRDETPSRYEAPPRQDAASHQDAASRRDAPLRREEASADAVDGSALPSASLVVPSLAPAPGPASPIKMTANVPSPGAATDACRGPFPGPRLAVGGTPPTVLPADSTASLGLIVDGAPGGYLIICGFAEKSVFSAGRSIDERAWILPVSEAADVTLIPPRGFVGPMKLVVALLTGEKRLADRRTLQLQWLPQTAAGVPAMPRMADVNAELEEGKRLRAAGNLAAARAIFQRIAQTGDSRAAFLLAETYDPIALAKHQLLPPDSDLERARLWYRRASEHGSPEANSRLDRLSNW